MLKKAFSPRGVDGVDEPAGSSSGVAVDPQDVKKPKSFFKDKKEKEHEKEQWGKMRDVACLHGDAADSGGLHCHDKELVNKRGLLQDLIKQLTLDMPSNLIKGKNLLTISMPVRIFEPRSFLEKILDTWYEAPVHLSNAADASDPVERMKHVLAWMISGFSRSFGNWQKPFNPLLGETWEGSMEDGTTIWCEQVSHHPPISSFVGRGPQGKFTIYGVSEPTVSFKGNAVKTKPLGRKYVRFSDGGCIEMTYPTYFVKNIVFGTPKGEIEGCASLVDMQNGLICEFDISPKGKPRSVPSDVLQGTIRKAVFVSDEDKEAAASQASKKRFYWSFKKEKMTDVPEGHPPVKQAFGHSRKSAHKEVPCVEQYGDIIAEFSGSWLSHIDFDSERFWTLNQCKSYRAIPSEKPLPSDSRFRKDLQLLKEGSGSKGDMGVVIGPP
mmetsp:Transcript_4225/g.15173  ORF Transcript_4225/g.15173 Transcript_4225/m.15173 type:complete len:438 (-) Transcript_4225:311-1624(-)